MFIVSKFTWNCHKHSSRTDKSNTGNKSKIVWMCDLQINQYDVFLLFLVLYSWCLKMIAKGSFTRNYLLICFTHAVIYFLICWFLFRPSFTLFLDWGYHINKCITVSCTYEKMMVISTLSHRHLAKELRNGGTLCQNSRKSGISLRSGIHSVKLVTDPLYVIVKGLTPWSGNARNTILRTNTIGQSQYEIVVGGFFAPL